MLEALRTRQYIRPLAHLLAMLLVVQALLPLQAHARLARSAQGLVLVLCTLQGPHRVAVTPPAFDDAPLHDDSAAMRFSDLLNHYTPITPLLPPLATVLYRTGLWQETPSVSPWRPAPPPQARGPPRV